MPVTLPPIRADLDRRMPVWEAWSHLYLDAELSHALREGIARDLADSGYSLDALRTILRSEVHPVCVRNLFSVAGEWAGFDREWLGSHILRRADSRLSWPAALSPGYRLVGRVAEAILARVSDLRRDRAAGHVTSEPGVSDSTRDGMLR